MQTLHRVFIKTAILYLLTGTALGGFMLVNKGWLKIGISREWVTLHNHLISVGFIMMMIMGVAYWMFPRPSGVALRDISRDPLPWANYCLLNLGLVLRVLSEPFPGVGMAERGLVVSALLQMLGIFLFVISIWKRVRFPSASPR